MTKDKVKIGFLPIACTRFKGMGCDTPFRYEERIQKRLDDLYFKASEFISLFKSFELSLFNVIGSIVCIAFSIL